MDFKKFDGEFEINVGVSCRFCRKILLLFELNPKAALYRFGMNFTQTHKK